MTTDAGLSGGGGGGTGGPVAPYVAPTDAGAQPADQGNPNNPTDNSAGSAPTNGVVNLQSGSKALVLVVNGKSITVTLNQQVDPTMSVQMTSGVSKKGTKGLSPEDKSNLNTQTVQQAIQGMSDWYGNTTKRQQIIDQMYSAGLITTKKNPSVFQVATAWTLLVSEAALEGSTSGGALTPEALLAKAATSGWNAISSKLNATDEGVSGTGNLNNAADASTTSSETIYKSYLDPATIMGAQADAWFRLMGRNPAPAEYQSFLNTVFAYQDDSNTGKFETKTSNPSDKVVYDPTTGQPVSPQGTDNGLGPTSTTNTVSQRGIGTRGLQFLAGQAALTSPEEGPYQAATTYFNAFIKGLSGPASGMQTSGPTTTVP